MTNLHRVLLVALLLISSSVHAAPQSNSSGAITTGGTFQTIAPSNGNRKAFEFHNICTVSGNCTATTNRCYLYVAGSGTPTTAKSIVVPPGAAYLRANGAVPTDAIKATCDGTGDKYYLSVQ